MQKLNTSLLEKISKLKEEIKQARNILITSHYSPDDDAIGSLLSLYQILKNPDQKVYMSLEDSLPQRHSFLKYSDKVIFSDLSDVIKDKRIDTLILLDGNELTRFSRSIQNFLDVIKDKDLKVLCVDHHLCQDPSVFDLYINMGRKSTAEQLFIIFQEELKEKLDFNIAQSLMVAILGDTNRFLYKNDFYKDTFEISAKLIEKGVSIEDLNSNLGRIDSAELRLMSTLFNNLHVTDSYNYSYFTDQDLTKFKKERFSSDSYSSAYHRFVDAYIRFIDNNHWGFVFVPDYNEKGVYKGSFRATNGTVDTTKFTVPLGGGGHKPASGFRIEANSWQDALTILIHSIESNLDEAIKSGQEK